MLCIALDTKEQQKKYLKQDEEHRYDDLFMDFSGKTYSSSITPIRTQMQMVKKESPKFDTRMVLLEKLSNILTRRIYNEPNPEFVEIHHLCYEKDR